MAVKKQRVSFTAITLRRSADSQSGSAGLSLSISASVRVIGAGAEDCSAYSEKTNRL
ncbi:MAG: hypothetical protein LBG87_04640 [Spirochaetaceae bacterium]|nr:hypothetical protein [Spirochaetaceae bacterium]